ncbi:MAG: o-succinylbenzoate synthase [Myxococcota bacterium]|nr:o-succinylbenzoate synthase [Myxococcota bacterium]
MTLRLELEPYRTAFSETISNAHTSWRERTGVVLRLTDGSGVVGQGEAAPLPGYSRETLEDATRALTALDERRLRELASLEDLGELANAVRAAIPGFVPSARFALETALLDRLAQRVRQPLYRLLVPDARPPAKLELAALVSSRDAAQRALKAGFSTLKLKLGPSTFDADLELLRALRRELGAGVRLRLDANQSLPGDGGHLAALAELAPEFVEEPFLAGLSLPRSPPVPLALDESLHVPAFSLTPELVRDFGVVAAVIKPGLVGGLLRGLELARDAGAVGLVPIVSHAFEGPIGFRAAQELARALGVTSHAAGLAPHAALGARGLPP